MAQLKITYNDPDKNPAKYVGTQDAIKYGKDCVAEFKRKLRKRLKDCSMYQDELLIDTFKFMIKNVKVEYSERNQI